MQQEGQQEGAEEQPNWWQLFKDGHYFTPNPRRGEIIQATVLAVGNQDMLVELDGKRDGVIQQRDLDEVDEEYLAEIEVGDQIPVRIVKVPFNRSGIIVSLKQGLAQQDWLRAKDMLETEEVSKVEVVGTNRGGVLVQFGRLRGFVPNSHLTSIPRGVRGQDRRDRKEALVGDHLHVAVIEVNPRRRRLVLSERRAQAQRRVEALERLHEGAVVEGVVRNIVDFGAFVDLGGIDGLVHVSELDWDYVEHPRDILSVGDEVEVYVLDVDRDRERVALSRKRLLPDPWELVTKDLHRGDVIPGKVSGVQDFGVFVDVGEGVEGLIYNSEIPQGQVREQLTPGTPVQVQVLEIDPLRQHIALRLDSVD
jgi:small subunit ribosomal protein S1